MLEQLWALVDHADKVLFLEIQRLHSSFFDVFFKTLSSTWFTVLFCIVLIIYLINSYLFSFRLFILWLLTSAVTEFISSQVLKPLFARLRPCQTDHIISQYTLIGKCGDHFSMPSSHATMAFSLAFGFNILFKIKSPVRVLVIIWASLVAYSRVYLGVHFPLDVIIGAFFGIFTTTITNNLK